MSLLMEFFLYIFVIIGEKDLLSLFIISRRGEEWKLCGPNIRRCGLDFFFLVSTDAIFEIRVDGLAFIILSFQESTGLTAIFLLREGELLFLRAQCFRIDDFCCFTKTLDEEDAGENLGVDLAISFSNCENLVTGVAFRMTTSSWSEKSLQRGLVDLPRLLTKAVLLYSICFGNIFCKLNVFLQTRGEFLPDGGVPPTKCDLNFGDGMQEEF
mmetsp:Transcript_36871/g.86118  ORF Transcript_36871/g.86118 Transcript_36871/m.86118 type:complete len:212 (-) Transcript_36871:1602-2237(-)